MGNRPWTLSLSKIWVYDKTLWGMYLLIFWFLVFYGSSIRISRKGWHMLLNFCFHTALTFAVFAGGINRIKYPIICQAVSAFPFHSSHSQSFSENWLWMSIEVLALSAICGCRAAQLYVSCMLQRHVWSGHSVTEVLTQWALVIQAWIHLLPVPLLSDCVLFCCQGLLWVLCITLFCCFVTIVYLYVYVLYLFFCHFNLLLMFFFPFKFHLYS